MPPEGRRKIVGHFFVPGEKTNNKKHYPWFEKVAQHVLRATDVHLWWGLSPHSRPPTDGPPPPEEEQWGRGAHVDMQATLADWQATPRRTRSRR